MMNGKDGSMKLALRCVQLIMAAACGMGLHVAAHATPDPGKVLRQAFEAADDGFDAQRTTSYYSATVAEAIFDSLLTYDYLARPAKLAPGAAEALPEIKDEGKTYVFHIRKGIYFAPDPVFKGAKRELTAGDFAYTIKRLFDPRTRSPALSPFVGKIVGMDTLAETAKKTGRIDYEAPVAGLQTPDRYTLVIRLNAPDHTFPYLLASPSTGAVAREAIEYYGEDTGRHPVGSGAYYLKEYTPRSKIVLEANPYYRGFVWDFKSNGDPGDDRIVKEMKGKQMPQVGRVEINIIEEDQGRWLAFDSKQHDIALLSDNISPRVLDKDHLKPEVAAKGIRLYRYPEPGITYTYFNFRDPVVGGYTLDKIALRRAIAMAYRIDDEISQIRFGQGVRAQSEVPPGVNGFDPQYRSSIAYDPDLANKLLDRFGYRKGPDGYRTLPDGKPLTLKIHSSASARDKAMMEIWKRSLDAVGIRVDFPVSNFADNLKAAYRCELSMWGLGGVASIPDGIDMLESYYGPNAGQGNLGCYESKEFDKAFLKARIMPDGPERMALFDRMERILEADTARMLHVWRVRNWLSQPWVLGFKKHPILHADWQYLDVDKK
jgi:ABC-type transport system substrate-binding protein